MKVSTDACLFGTLIETDGKKMALDIGTGTGLLALMLAQRSDAMIDAVEVDGLASIQAESNAMDSPWHTRVQVIHSKIQQFALLPEKQNNYDLIVSNPPFYENQTPSRDQKKQKAWHSSELSIVELGQAISSLLSSAGSAWILYPKQGLEKLISGFETFGLLTQKIISVKPSPMKQINRAVIEFGFQKSTPSQMQIQIYDQHHEYTKEFKKLLTPYYLKL